MIEGLKPYASYKEAGVSWLGRVPTHWRVVPNRALFIEVKERNHPDEEILSVTITRGVIQQSTLLADSSKKDGSNQDRSAYKLVQPGDIAYNKMRAWQGAIGVSSFRGIISPAYVVMRPREACSSAFFHQFFRTPGFAKEAQRWSYGITSDMWSLRPEHFRMIYSILPPEEERAAIVRYLNHVDHKVNRYISAKKKLIELLNEQKQAIIHRAVTRGLDPNVRLKSSGVEWIGDHPSDWTVSRLKFICSRIVDCLHATPVYDEDGQYPAIRTADVEPGRLRLSQARKLNRAHYEAWTVRMRPEASDILYTREGERYGIAAIVPDGVELCISQRMMAFRVKPECCSEYVMWQLNTPGSYKQASQDVMGSTSPHVNVSTIRNLFVVVPSLEEQKRIVEFIKKLSAPLDQAIAKTRKEIEYVFEYRTRLVADVVTGKLDVREAAAKLPDITSEAEPLDEIEEVLQDEPAAEDLEVAEAA